MSKTAISRSGATLALGLTLSLIACARRPGPIDTASFRAYIEQVLVPTLRPGDVVILDNLAVYKQPDVQAAIEHAGARLGGAEERI